MAITGLQVRAQTLTPVRVTTALRLANYTPAYTALREGIFAKHGLAVEIAAASSVAEPISILNAGRAEFAMTGTGMAINSAIEGADTRVIAKMAGAIGLWFISKPGAGVKSLEDLKGKTIASYRFPSNTVSSPTLHHGRQPHKSFFSSLKTERAARKVYRTRDEARADVFDCIERFYNPRRRHSKLGYVSPMEFEARAMLA